MRSRHRPWAGLVVVAMLGVALLPTLCGCTPADADEHRQADSLNLLAHRFRYVSIDSTLHYAHQAMQRSTHYPQGQAMALCHLAYVAYQQMRYDNATHYLDRVYTHCRSQVELLCADVMYMKVAQRTGRGLLFFEHRSQATRRLRRIAEDGHLLTPVQEALVRYAQSEMHIISSTYYFYFGQQQQAVDEIRHAALDTSLPQDTAQWLYYRYMLGSGGLLSGDSLEVALQEFDHLFYTYKVATLHRVGYFQANALQSLATLLDHPTTSLHLAANRPGALDQLRRDHQHWHALPQIHEYGRLPLVLADHALHLFQEQKDLFQLACAHRTVGEIYFRHQEYHRALDQFAHALQLVESQKSRSQWQVPFWNFSMHEYLSLTYSALGDKEQSDHHRNLYLDYLEQNTQDYELEERKNQLEREFQHTRISLFTLLSLIALSSLLLWALRSRLRHQSRRLASATGAFEDMPQWQQFAHSFDRTMATLADKRQELEEYIHLHRMHIAHYRRGNVERRAKVAMVGAVVPYIDRILAEVGRMRRTGESAPNQLHYVSELSAEIMRINDVLTHWIQMKQGQLQLHITSFPLAQVFAIIRSSEVVFQRQGLTLEVADTPLRVKADMVLTLFMINTLCDNARKFTPAGGVVRVTAQATEEGVEISVSDTGIGLSEADVASICGQAVLTPSTLGAGTDGKGFGFGIMNCKGIIAKYRKASARFATCQFGVESRVGQGSRFWFRLPSAMAIALCLCLGGLTGRANTPDSIVQANIQGHYAQAYAMGQRYVQTLVQPTDTATLLGVLNEMSVAAMALNRWDDYYRSNTQLLHLHSLYTADMSLPAYCQQMERMKNNNIFVYALLVLVSLLALLLFCLLSLRGILRRDTYSHSLRIWLQQLLNQAATQMDDCAAGTAHLPALADAESMPPWMDNLPPHLAQSAQQCTAGIASRMAQVRQAIAEVEQLQATASRLEFEKDRLYVANQVLDNCLSTIKHETMYYPARTQQLAEGMLRTATDQERAHTLDDLDELTRFYRQVYMLLYQQALRQTAQQSLCRRAVDLSTLDAALPPIHVVADPTLLTLLVEMLRQAEAATPTLHAEPHQGFALITATWMGVERSAEELADLFQPTSRHIPLMVVKQIVREHDQHAHHAPLRLVAKAVQGGYAVQFTLPLVLNHDK